MVISSAIVNASNNSIKEVENLLNSFPQVEIVELKENKFAIVLETSSTDEAIEIAEKITQNRNVSGYEIISHFFEEEINKQE